MATWLSIFSMIGSHRSVACETDFHVRGIVCSERTGLESKTHRVLLECSSTSPFHLTMSGFSISSNRYATRSASSLWFASGPSPCWRCFRSSQTSVRGGSANGDAVCLREMHDSMAVDEVKRPSASMPPLRSMRETLERSDK